VTDAVVSVWGKGRVGMHLAPRGDAHSMGDSQRRETFTYLARALGERGIAFLCAREYEAADSLGAGLKAAFGGPYIANEKFTFESAERALSEGRADAVAFGRLFIANPDLPRRFALGAPLNALRTDGLYMGGAKGYTDYPALGEDEATPPVRTATG